MSLGSIRRQLAVIPHAIAASLQSPEKTHGAKSVLSEADLRAALEEIVRERLCPVAAGLGVLYLAFAVSHRLVLPEAVAALMSLVAAGTAALLIGLYFLLGRWSMPSRGAHPIAAAMAGLVLLNSLLHLYLLSEPQQTTNLMLLVIGVGCLFLCSGWFALALAATMGGWGLVVWGAAPSPAWVHFGFGLLSASVLSVLIHTVRVRTFRRLERNIWERMRTQAALRQANKELEHRVEERTAELAEANARLRHEATERQQAADVVRRSEEHFRLLIENAPDLIILLNSDGTVRYQSPSAERVLGYKPAEAIGQSGFAFIHPDDLPHVIDIFTTALQTPGIMPPVEMRVRHQDGSWHVI